jgi:DNA-binding GntR family transcriptional regulator
MNPRVEKRWKIDEGLPVGPQLYRILRERIIRNDLSPGNRLSEAEFAVAYAVSRQPVREAFIKLAEVGLVDVRPQRGTYVRKISRDAVMDARFVREAIEADIVRCLAAEADSELVAELREQLEAQRKVIRDPERFMKSDERFHRTLAVGAGKSYAWSVVEGLKAQMDRVRFLSLIHFPTAKLVAQHTAIVDAIEAGSEPRAEIALRAHLREILNDLPAITLEKPEFFDEAAS